MVIQDIDTLRNRAYKERMQNLTDEEKDMLNSLTETQQESLLRLKDPTLSWGLRYQAGTALPSEVLHVVTVGTRDFKTVADVIMFERGRRK